ncbi:MAG: M48 family metallopeptidase [Fimbriimonadales bacterium]
MADFQAFMIALCVAAAIYPFLAARRFRPRYESSRDDPLPSHAENQARFDRGRSGRVSTRLVWLTLAIAFLIRWSRSSDDGVGHDPNLPYFIVAVGLFCASLIGATLDRYRWETGFASRNPRLGESVQPLSLRLWAAALVAIPLLLIVVAMAVRSLEWSIGLGIAAFAALVVRQKVLLAALARSRKEVAPDSPLALGLTEMSHAYAIQPKRFLLIPAMIANGWALPDGTIMLTSALREIATDEEIVAILAHEFSHAKDGDARRLQRANGIAVGGVCGLLLGAVVVPQISLTPILMPTLILTLVVSIQLARLPVLAFSRRLEHKCDAEAAKRGYGPSLASGLDKLHRYMGLPLTWGSLDEPFLTHPSLYDRLARIARIGAGDPPAPVPDEASRI